MRWTKVVLTLLCASLLFLNLPTNSVKADTNQNLPTHEDYGLFAVWFIASDKHQNEDSGWDANTRIKDIIEIHDINNQLIGYTFELINNGTNNGYIFVRNVEGNLSVAEYSYQESPQYRISEIDGEPDKVYFVSSLEYYMESNNKLYSLEEENVSPTLILNTQRRYSEQTSEVNPEVSQFLRNIGSLEQWIAVEENDATGVALRSTQQISDVYNYVINTYGTGWTMKSQKTLSITARLQSSFEANVENCTLSSLTQAFFYFRSSYPNIASNITTLYNDIKTIATSHGYTSSGGTPPTKIDNIITDIWKKYNYNNGKGNNDYLISFGIFKGEIDNDRPALFNMANGYYTNHTVLVKGYRIYEKSGIFNDDKNFLRLNDNWSTGERWIDYSAWSCCGSVSRFVTP